MHSSENVQQTSVCLVRDGTYRGVSNKLFSLYKVMPTLRVEVT